MKKLFSFFVSIILVAGFFIAPCFGDVLKNQDNGNLKVVTTIFPIYDWVREISKSENQKADLTLLLDIGVDLHSYQPTVQDMIKISTCDVFIYVGGTSDEWVNRAMKNTTNKNQVVLNLLDVLGSSVKSEEIIEGMEHEHHHNHHDEDEHDEDDHEHEHESEIEQDEHIWLSLRNAKIICKKISDVFSEIDPENKNIYQENARNYLRKLDQLDQSYKSVIDNSKRKIVLFGDRFPFRYLFDDYGLKYYAAFSGCSAETEASFETIIFLSKKVDEFNLPYVLTIDGVRHKIPEIVIAGTKEKNQSVMSLNSMQSITVKDIKEGATYLSIMEKNLEVLKTVLN